MIVLKALWEGWKKFAFVFSEVMSAVVLTLFYFVFITPYAVFVKLFSDPLNIRKALSGSGWRARATGMTSLDDARMQY